jgi:ethanolamine utilization protein EutN
MRLGKVIGRVWATQKADALKGCALYVVQPVESDGREKGQPLVVADPRGISGPGDRVVYVTNTDAVQAFDKTDPPVNACVVELVDFIE